MFVAKERAKHVYNGKTCSDEGERAFQLILVKDTSSINTSTANVEAGGRISVETDSLSIWNKWLKKISSYHNKMI